MNDTGYSDRLRRWCRLCAIAILLFVFNACNGGGCDCDGFSEEPFPEEHYDKTVPGSAEVRITSHGLDFIADEIDNLVDEVADDGLSFCVPPTEESGASICHEDSTCDDGSTGCQLELEIEDAELTPEAPNKLIVHLVIGGLLADLPIEALGASCWLHLYSDSGGDDVPATIPVTVPVAFEVDSESELNDIKIELDDIDADLDDVDYSMSGRDSWDITCGSLGWGVQTFLDGTLRDLLTDELDNVVDDLTEEELCRSCEEGDHACPSNSTCVQDDEDDPALCMYDEDECVPMLLGIEGLLELEALLGDMLPHAPADVHVTGRMADRAEADSGMSLAMRVGSEPQFMGTCIDIEASERPSFEEIPPSPSINADEKPGGDPFMFGIGVHENTIKHALWSVWASSALCLEIGPEQSDMLSTGTFDLFLDTIGDIATRDAPMKIRLAPQIAPDVHLGANQVNDGLVEEGLIIIDWRDLDIHMYGFVQERYARLFTLRIDLELPIALMADGDNAILPVLGDFEEAIHNMRILNDDLTNEDVETFEELIPTLLGFALPDLMSEISDPIDLPDLMGYQLVLGDDDITAVDDNEVLAIFASLEFVGTEESEEYRLAPRALVTDEELVFTGDDGEVPEVSLILDVTAEQGGTMLNGSEVEFLYSFDGSMWRPAGTGPKLQIDDPRLRLQGEQELMLRARDMSTDGARWQSDPTVMDVLVDYEAPRLQIWQQGEQIRVDADDVVDDIEEMAMRHRFVVDGEAMSWSSWELIDAIDIDKGAGADELAIEVEVRDRAGHTSHDDITIERAALGEVAESGDEVRGCGGCGATGGSTPPVALLLVLVGFVALRLRRRISRRSVAIIAVSAMALMATGCSGCSDEVQENANEEEQCPDGCEDDEECIDNECVFPGCEADDECDASQCADDEYVTCEDGDCMCNIFCADGCGEEQFCCYDSDSCVDLPDPCDGVSCDLDGYEPELVEMSSVEDNESCEINDGECECVPMPPIPMRYHGSYLSIDRGDQITAISVHNLGYGDLMVGIVEEEDKQAIQEWVVVDGIPDGGTIGGDPYGFRQGVLTSGPEVGTHTALAVDDDDRIHVFYRHEGDDTLKYARGEEDGDEWEFETTLVEQQEVVESGYFSALHLRDDTLHLFYSVRLDEGASELRYRSIAIDHPVDEMMDTDYEVLHEGVTDEEGPEDYLRLAALFVQVVEDEEGALFVSFYDNTRHEAGWMREDGDGFGEPVFLDDDAGPYASARPDSEGEVHVAFMDQTMKALIYRTEDGEREYVVDGIRDHAGGYSEMPVGHDVQLFVDGDDVEVLYHDASTHELRRAVRDDGSWEVDTLAGVAGEEAPAQGLFVRALTLGDERLVVDFSVDTTGDDEPVGHPTFRMID